MEEDPESAEELLDELSQQEVAGVIILPGVNDLPEFANPEARKIYKKNLEDEQDIEKLSDAVYDMKNRIKVMKDHFKNVQQEVEHTNALNGAKQAEIRTEEHLKQLTSRALGRAQLDSKKIQADIEFTKDQLNSVQTLTYKATEKMEEFKLQMNWNQDELEQWVVASRQKEDDNAALERYKRSDDAKIKEMSLQLVQLTKELLQTKSRLDDEATETFAKQMELDRIAIEFKTSHKERQDLVNRWQEIITEMKNRDREINDIGERFAIAKTERAKREMVMNLQQKKIGTQQLENKEVESRAELLGRIVLRKREEMMITNNKLLEFRGELESLKNELTTSAESLVTKRNKNTHDGEMLEDKKVLLERERQKYQYIKSKIEIASNNTLKAEKKAKDAEDELTKREKEYSDELTRVKEMKNSSIREHQYVHEMKAEEGRLRSEMSGPVSCLILSLSPEYMTLPTSASS